MAPDKNIPQLTPGTPQLSDLLVGDNGVITYKFTDTQLLALLQANLSVGAIFTFSTGAIPSNTIGNNGDVFWKKDTGQIAQKLSGVWTVVYTIVQGVVGSTIYYGSVAPTTQGINGDTYLQTVGGKFYTKIAGSWVLQFSMATGPVGPQGAAGTNGTNGTNGLTILNGTTNPINYTTGVDGDFYINTSTWNLFGPRGQSVAGVWPTGVNLSFSSIAPVIISIPAGSTYPFVLPMNTGTQAAFNTSPLLSTKIILLNSPYAPVSGSSATQFTQKFDVQIDVNFTDGTQTVISNITVWGYPTSPVSGSPVTQFDLLLILKP
jgi:hypothetical protein